jgi:hypothetical protein
VNKSTQSRRGGMGEECKEHVTITRHGRYPNRWERAGGEEEMKEKYWKMLKGIVGGTVGAPLSSSSKSADRSMPQKQQRLSAELADCLSVSW